VNTSRDRRVARNHALFRDVNERIYSLTEEFGSHPADDGLSLAFVCECGTVTCTSQLLVETDDYSRIRSHQEAHFVVLKGHEQPDVEQVIEANGHYVVVARPEVAAG
jgi:hypothetical protein